MAYRWYSNWSDQWYLRCQHCHKTFYTHQETRAQEHEDNCSKRKPVESVIEVDFSE